MCFSRGIYLELVLQSRDRFTQLDFLFSVAPSDLLLRLGEHDLSLEDEPYGYQERRVQIVASHPQFDPRTFEYDLALLRFYEPVSFQPNIIPVCVPQDDTNFVGSTAYVTGWGRLYEGRWSCYNRDLRISEYSPQNNYVIGLCVHSKKLWKLHMAKFYKWLPHNSSYTKALRFI